ncbi:MAG: ABC transporter permease [Lautropia sp.]
MSEIEHEAGQARWYSRLRRAPAAQIGGLLLLLLIAASFLAPIIAPYPPDQINLARKLEGLGAAGHVLGTDNLGRDMLSRVLYGGRTSLIAALIAVMVGAAIGILPGLLAGFLGGHWDRWLSLVADALQTIPPLILAMLVIAMTGAGLANAMVAVGVLFAPRYFRVIRACTLSVRSEAFVDAARTMGMTGWAIMRRHVIRHMISPIIVVSTFLAGLAMLYEAGLSFLGLGVQLPTASWGSMLATAFAYVSVQPFQGIVPGLAIATAIFACNLLGDGLSKVLEPRGQRAVG